MEKKKLIEVALPLEAINNESIREKSIRKGHPSTLHLWWARRPLAAARAVIWASLVDDPSSHPEMFPTEEEQNTERKRLFRILEQLVVWENSIKKEIINAAKNEILHNCNENPPTFLDPFAGGGAIPLEAQRLGLETYAHDLNPIAVLINKAMIEIPYIFAGQSPVNPNSQNSIESAKELSFGTKGMALDVQYYGERIKQIAYKAIGDLYPKATLPSCMGNGSTSVIAWIWARTTICPNPLCGKEVPLIGSYVLSKRKGHEAYLVPNIYHNSIKYKVAYGKIPKEAEYGTKHYDANGKGKKATFCCPFCKEGIITGNYIDDYAKKHSIKSIPIAKVVETNNGRGYLPIEDDFHLLEEKIKDYYISNDVEDKIPHEFSHGTFASNAQGREYGFKEFKDYFSTRQLIALSTFSETIESIRREIEIDALNCGMNDSGVGLDDNGNGAYAYSQAIEVYLSFVLSRMVDKYSSVCVWNNVGEKIEHTFGRQAIPIAWDYAEANPFSHSSGCYSNMLDFVVNCLNLPFLPENKGVAMQFDAQSDCGFRNILVSTDPPYYDNIAYSDLSDFFYVWARPIMKDIYPSLFSTMLTPKKEEIVATPFQFAGDKIKAKDHFETGMRQACERIYTYCSDDYPLTIYYAYKQSDKSNDASSSAMNGWETMLSAIVKSRFTITGTWPIRTERQGRLVGNGTNALASSIVLVCRKRKSNAPQITRRNLIKELRKELRPALEKLQSSNIAPVDLAQSAIGPGMAVFSRYEKVLEADGSEMSIRNALQVINEELDLYFNEQVSDLDAMSRFCVDLYTQVAFNDIKYGEADVLARAKGISVEVIAQHGPVYAKAGNVHLIERNQLPAKVDTNEKCVWMLTQQLTQLMTIGGIDACAKEIYEMMGSNVERAKDLAYRLYTIAEQKKWTDEAYAYNSLVVAWPDIQTRAAELASEKPEQLNLFD